MSRIDRLRVLYGNNVKEYKGYIEIKDNNNRLFIAENGRKIHLNYFCYHSTFGDIVLFSDLTNTLVIHKKNGKSKIVYDIATVNTFDRQYLVLAYKDKIGIYDGELNAIVELNTDTKVEIEFIKSTTNRIEVILSCDNKEYSHVLIYDFTINAGKIIEYSNN